VHLKAAYDVSMADGDDVDPIVSRADASERKLECELSTAEITTIDDIQAVLAVALCLLREGSDDERMESLLGLSHRGLNSVRNAMQRVAA
jgi:hypothetical protein